MGVAVGIPYIAMRMRVCGYWVMESERNGGEEDAKEAASVHVDSAVDGEGHALNSHSLMLQRSQWWNEKGDQPRLRQAASRFRELDTGTTISVGDGFVCIAEVASAFPMVKRYMEKVEVEIIVP
jgi:hypothetical protein